MAKRPRTVAKLRDIPNIGPQTEGDLHRIGITKAEQLIGQNGYKLYDRLCRKDRVRHDPCVIDVFFGGG